MKKALLFTFGVLILASTVVISQNDTRVVNGVNILIKSSGDSLSAPEFNALTGATDGISKNGGDWIFNDGNIFFKNIDQSGNPEITNIRELGKWEKGYTSGHIYFGTDTSGMVGIGTNNPEVKLHVKGDIKSNSTVYNSDKRYKDNIKTLENSLDNLDKIRGVSFEWNTENRKGEHDLGFIAQEIETVYPELVHTNNNGYKSVDYPKMTAILLQAVKELKAEVEELKAQ